MKVSDAGQTSSSKKIPTTVMGSFGLSAQVLAASASAARVRLVVPLDWHYLRGHFPRFAVVPGMVILDLADRVSRSLLAMTAVTRELVVVRFVAPLMPDELLELECSVAGSPGTVVARGSVEGRELCYIELDYDDDDGEQA